MKLSYHSLAIDILGQFAPGPTKGPLVHSYHNTRVPCQFGKVRYVTATRCARRSWAGHPYTAASLQRGTPFACRFSFLFSGFFSLSPFCHWRAAHSRRQRPFSFTSFPFDYGKKSALLTAKLFVHCLLILNRSSFFVWPQRAN